MKYAALFRGINVGTAKRVSMADLRSLFEGLGFRDVQTLLNSGNVVFSTDKAGDHAKRIEEAMVKKIGFPSRVLILSEKDLAAIIKASPLRKHEGDPSRLFVGFLMKEADRKKLAPMCKQDWGKDVFAAGQGAAYFFCPGGLSQSQIPIVLQKALGENATTRNWATVTKLHALVSDEKPEPATRPKKRAPR